MTTWTQLVPALVHTCCTATSAAERQGALDELLKLAAIVDAHVAQLEKLRDEPPQTTFDERASVALCAACGNSGFLCDCHDVYCEHCGSVNMTTNCGDRGCPHPYERL